MKAVKPNKMDEQAAAQLDISDTNLLDSIRRIKNITLMQKLRFTATSLLSCICLLGMDLGTLALANENNSGGDPRADTKSLFSRYQVFFGDLHVHTRNSSDAYMFRVHATPHDAYRFARGETIMHTLGFPMKLHGPPLDFIAVTDHGELLGVLDAMSNPADPLSELRLAKELQHEDRAKVVAAFFEIVRDSRDPDSQLVPQYSRVMRTVWQDNVKIAEQYNQPGKFTSLIGYEYSSAPDNQNLHRNVIFSGSQVPKVPFTAIDSDNPEQLWHWLDRLRDEGIDGLAIPHNSNVSNGLMFERSDWSGRPIDADYANLRMRNEPLVEITQVKGTSETHPLLSPNDEWAEFELYDTLIASSVVAEKSGGFVREAYRHGLEFQDAANFNPYKFGLVGASDSHNAGGSFAEKDFAGKAGALDGTPELRGTVPGYEPRSFGGDDAAASFSQWGASGLTGVWAEENTREALFAALRRKETFATSGPRIRVLFFAGFKFDAALLNDPDLIARAHEQGVAMGSNLNAKDDSAPSFLLWAMRDPDDANLQRLQVVKGWVSAGQSHEAVFDVACSDGLLPDEKTYRCPDNGADVDLSDCSPSGDRGAVELKSLWKDPQFDPDQHSFYYLRVLQNPTCRWSTWDALQAGAAPKPGLAITIQDRAWSSPIWYSPATQE